MNWVLNKAFEVKQNKPTALFRCVDDIFCVFNNNAELIAFFNNLNSIHANIKFTKELETNFLIGMF